MGQAMERLQGRMAQQQVEVSQTPAGAQMLERGQTVQQMRLDNYMTAVSVQQPRDKRRVIKEVEFEAELLGPKAYYSWTAKGKQGRSLIEGPTVDLAMVLTREWGNCAARADLVAETDRHYLFDGIFLDLERGVTIVRQFRQVKERNLGKMDADRAEDITFQVGQSKGIRNAVLAGIPQWLIDKAVKKAKAAAAKSLTPERVIEAFAKWDVDPKALERRVGKASKRWDEMDMAELRGVYQALLDGVTSIETEFGDEQAIESVSQAAEAAAKAASTITPQETVDPETGEVSPAPEQKPEPEPEQKSEEDDGPTPAATKAIAAFGEHNVTREQLEKKLELPAEKWKRGELSKLRAMLRGIKDGSVTVEAMFAEQESADDGGSWE